MKKSKSGFTIVELLIVIVVIAILAAITIVAYNGIQQRANNTRIISAASQTLKAVKAYQATYGTYPSTSHFCVTPTCHNGSASSGWYENTAARTELLKVGTLPSDLPSPIDATSGIQYIYNPSDTYNSEPTPVSIVYYLFGNKIDCKLANVRYTPNVTHSAPTYTTSWGDNRTSCNIAVSVT